MIKLKEIAENIKKYTYIGDCVTILDDPSSPFIDASAMAYMIENGDNNIGKKEFEYFVSLSGSPRLLKLELRKNPHKFTFGKNDNFMWAYNEETDIHYFFYLWSN